MRGILALLRGVLALEAREHPARTEPGFLAVTDAAVEEAIFCVEQAGGIEPTTTEGGRYLFCDGGSTYRVQMDGKTAKNRLTSLLNIYAKSGGASSRVAGSIREAIRCVEIIHREELDKDVLYRTFEPAE